MRKSFFGALGLCAIAAVALGVGPIRAAKPQPPFIRITPGQIRWRDVPNSHGVQESVLGR